MECSRGRWRRTVVALAVPPDDTSSCVPDEIVRLVVTPDASTLMMPPLLNVLLVRLAVVSVKPEPTSRIPPALIVTPLNTAPPSRSRVPPDSTVPPLTLPPADTISCVPDEIVRFDVTPDASTLMIPPLLNVLLVRLAAFSVKPAPTSRMPLALIVTALNTAPLSRSKVPPDSTVPPDAEPALDTIALPPLSTDAALKRPPD